MQQIPQEWWPDFIAPLEDDTFVQDGLVTVAEIVEPTGEGSYRQVFTALAPRPVADVILGKLGTTGLGGQPASIGIEVSSTGPHPSVAGGEGPPGYEPRFWIFGGEAAPEGLEPLVVSWRSANTTILRLDQGFLMTYGLVPRFVSRGSEIDEHWDDNEEPRTDIVVSRPRSLYDFPRASAAWVKVRREYLEDYAFIRDRSLLHVIYGHAEGSVTGRILASLRKTKGVQLRCPGREVSVHLKDDAGHVHVRYWVTRRLMDARISPITAGRWDYGELCWPGIAQPVTDRMGMPTMDFVYVKDSVLAVYEGRVSEGFRIYPESGSVHYRGQWAVSYIQRIGRDLLQFELRKLYEGCRPSVVRHWHAHSVPPPANLYELYRLPNVATRSKAILFGVLALGESIADLTAVVCGQPLSSVDTVGLDRESVQYRGWWDAPHLEPVTCHIPMDMKEDRFLDRMTDLTKVVIEALREKALRDAILGLGYDPEETRDWKSLRLLKQLVHHCEIARRSGLDPLHDARAIADRLHGADASGSVAALKALNALRILDAHRAQGSKRETLIEALSSFGIDLASTAGGWGRAADRVYDETANALEDLTKIISGAAGTCRAQTPNRRSPSAPTGAPEKPIHKKVMRVLASAWKRILRR